LEEQYCDFVKIFLTVCGYKEQLKLLELKDPTAECFFCLFTCVYFVLIELCLLVFV